MTPPPVLEERNFSGRASIETSQSRTWVSSSVQAGLVDHSIPCTPKPDESRSPRMPGPDPFAGKYPKKFGDCQCVMPGMMRRSISLRMRSNGSPDLGASAGSDARIAPGAEHDITGYFSMLL